MTRLWPWLTFWLCLLCLAAPAGAQPLVTVSGEDHWISVGVATVDRRAIGTAALPMDWPRDERRDHLPAASSTDGV